MPSIINIIINIIYVVSYEIQTLDTCKTRT